MCCLVVVIGAIVFVFIHILTHKHTHTQTHAQKRVRTDLSPDNQLTLDINQPNHSISFTSLIESTNGITLFVVCLIVWSHHQVGSQSVRLDDFAIN